MRSRDTVLLFSIAGGFLACLLLWNSLWPAGAEAKVRILPGTTPEADEQTVTEILGLFEQAEEAIKGRDIDTMMTVYSKSYDYHGLTKSEMRHIWESLFANHRDLSTSHIFTRINLTRREPTFIVEVTCTGSLYARSDITGQKTAIDSWYEEVHYLVKEDGKWRIRGNAGERAHALQFGTAPHPLF